MNTFTELTEVRRTDVVLDTCILMDLLFAERAGHAAAVRLGEVLRASGVRALIPVHAAFEFLSAAASEVRRRGAPLTLTRKPDDLLPFEVALVVLDLNFLTECLLAPLQAGTFHDVSGGDMIFAVIAHRHDLVLVSADEPLRRKAARTGIVVVSADEYMQRPGPSPT
jgi:hypothetical protein